MKIALTADPELPVPPRLYGGIERVIDMLAKGLVDRGHDVTVFAHPESATAGRLVKWPGRRSGFALDTARNAAALAREVASSSFDVIHSFSRIAYLAPLLPLEIPKIMTYQRAVTPRSIRLGHRLSRGTLSFTAISNWMMRDVLNIGRWAMVPNGVPLEVYKFSARVDADAPLVFLGRLEEIKGPHLAIDVANQTGRRLIIAGNIPDAKRKWVEAHVLSRVDGSRIRYIGPVDDAQKAELLASASALLMPILWDEPFGIVMAEAMACGAPVIGLNRGAVPEVVVDGTTGFVGDTIPSLVAGVGQISRIDRANCRARVEELYSERAIVEGYLSVYRDRVDGHTNPVLTTS